MMAKTSTTWLSAATIVLFSFAFHEAYAQGLAQQGTSVGDIVPSGWTHLDAQGDLNKDGISDLVVVATPDYPEHLLTRDDGYVYNFNQPVLAIYFGEGQGQLQLWKQYDNVIPANDNVNCSHDISLNITDRGALRISIQLFCSMGSYGTSIDTYTYRYQQGDFCLIGADHEEMQRNTGESTVVSENYTTCKRQVKKSNVFDEAKQPSEKWSRLPKKPLERLGDRTLEE